MASNLIDMSRLETALSEFKMAMLTKAKPNHFIMTFASVAIAQDGTTILSISRAQAGVLLANVTLLSVSVQDAWPQESWTGGACVSVVNYGVQNGSLVVTLTTTTPQYYRLGLDVAYVTR